MQQMLDLTKDTVQRQDNSPASRHRGFITTTQYRSYQHFPASSPNSCAANTSNNVSTCTRFSAASSVTYAELSTWVSGQRFGLLRPVAGPLPRSGELRWHRMRADKRESNATDTSQEDIPDCETRPTRQLVVCRFAFKPPATFPGSCKDLTRFRSPTDPIRAEAKEGCGTAWLHSADTQTHSTNRSYTACCVRRIS